MQLTEVSLSDLSAIQHKVYLPETEPFSFPEFKVISFQGVYGYGSAGKGDAKYMVAVTRAAHEAWYTDGTVLDFSTLEYEWGDEMEWVLDFGNCNPTNCSYPLAVVVGQKCEPALRSLFNEEYSNLCFASLEDAVAALQVKQNEYRLCLEQWRKDACRKA